MSKLKLMYDVINTMKDKETISGTLKVAGTKDQANIVNFVNNFEKNLSTGETKVKLSTEMDYDGKKVKHESQTEFTMPGCHGNMHHGLMRHMHHHHFHHHDVADDNGCQCGGFKAKLTKLAYALNIFNQIKVEEKEDKSVMLSLSVNEIPEEIKKTVQERMKQRAAAEHGHHHGFLKEFFMLQEPDVELRLWISKNREVERILVTVEGKQINDQNETHDLNLNAELCLA